jgi:hypothetical protein
MSESQSRYSIVERLTETKLNIIQAKSQLDEEAKTKEQKIEQLKKDLLDWNSEAAQETERTKKQKQREIERAEIEYKNAKERKASKEKAFDEKLRAIDEALKRIEEISKTSPTINQ